ncbi:MAG: DNA topoisomerase IB [Chloroflexi bacterium]|nr:DNA topoisomerase IB [Chloroflexota bacterium]
MRGRSAPSKDMGMARLRYVSAKTRGYQRKRRGRGFTYLDPRGEVVRDPELLEWFGSLGIPPAWTEVWISPYRNGHILATGRDDKGRKQYRYHPDWQAERSQQKYDELLEFGRTLPRLREVSEEYLRQRTLTREQVLAAIVRLLETTLIRIGNEEYARHNESYGLTTLTDDHAQVNGSEIVFEFVGKSKKQHTVVLRDRRLAKIVKRCQDIEGYELFQYFDEAGNHQVIDSADVNAYLHEVTGQPFTAKVFRTWGGSSLAIKFLCEQCADVTPEAAARNCVAHVSESLGNTKTICRKYYIHPAILDAHQDGRLCDLYAQHQRETGSDLDLAPEERTLLALIEQLTTPG